ncbi:hypothetical protein ACFLWR_03200 [Chloroflexota bacterium]
MAGKGKLYQLLNPEKLQHPVNTLPLAPRPNIINGKEFYFSITGDPDIPLPLEKRFKSDYHPIKWRVERSYTVSSALMKEEMRTTDSQVQRVAW